MPLMKFTKNTKVKEKVFDEKWKILIVDDEPDVHKITKSVLKHFIFEHKEIEFYSVYSGDDAVEFMKNNDNISVILLDVVMETDDAGLKV
ncbi:MAG TPA: response regulator, partial [Arcobacter sp.]|nr:response regulator [Arcobacter sp.]